MKRTAVGLLCMVFSWVGIPAVHAVEGHDWQFWTAESVECRVAGQWKVRAEGQFYFGDDMSELYYRHADVGFSRPVADWFRAGINYRFVQSKKAGDWKDENRPHINGTFQWKAGPVRFSNRHRLEYRTREDADDFWRYRSKLRADLPSSWTGARIQPYLSDEVYVDLKAEELNQNRASIGFKAPLNDHLKIDVYYLFLSGKNKDEWIDANVMGLNLRLSY